MKIIEINIPVFENLDLFKIQLNFFKNENLTGVLVNFIDDSMSPCIEDYFIKVKKTLPDGIMYYKNKNNIGAARNWNLILSQSKGQYVQILHHDELPLRAGYVERMKLYLQNDQTDVAVLCLVNKDNKPIFPIILKKIYIYILKKFPLFCNMLGSPSVIILKNKSIRYDERLSWYIDVEYFSRLLKSSPRVDIVNEKIITLLNKRSITNSLDVKSQAKVESVYIRSQHNLGIQILIQLSTITLLIVNKFQKTLRL